jgi:thiamine-phosphate diphosphorylase
MGRPQLHVVTDSRLALPRLRATVVAALDGGVDVVQVRDKAAPPEALVALVREVRAAVAGRAPVIVNGAVDTALTATADGVHLPEGHPDLGRARRLLGNTAYLGASAHSVAAARRAERAGVDSVTFGHIYATASHPDEPARGLAALREVATAIRIPVIAIGGIDASQVTDVLAAGAAGVAVISAIFAAADPRAAAGALRAALDAAAGGPGGHPDPGPDPHVCSSSHRLYSR